MEPVPELDREAYLARMRQRMETTLGPGRRRHQ
jgi:hypothetical protein